LDRHPISCPASYALNRFHIETLSNSDNIQIDYNCVPIPNLTNCTNISTPFNDDGNGNTTFLDRLPVNCGEDQVMTALHLTRNSDGNQIRFDYTCCSQANS
jgi:hypothetical protein